MGWGWWGGSAVLCPLPSRLPALPLPSPPGLSRTPRSGGFPSLQRFPGGGCSGRAALRAGSPRATLGTLCHGVDPTGKETPLRPREGRNCPGVFPRRPQTREPRGPPALTAAPRPRCLLGFPRELSADALGVSTPLDPGWTQRRALSLRGKTSGGPPVRSGSVTTRRQVLKGR